MASHGGTLAVDQAATRAARLALSGPVGGVEAAVRLGAMLGRPGLVTLDMGGTSTDVSLVMDGAVAREPGGTIGGLPLALPHVLVETVGAGGGSIAWLDKGDALRVGPRSAGAVPGPACYGRGGTEPTVTDAAVVLGWLDPGQPIAAGLTLDADAARRAVAALAERAGLTVERCAEGIVQVAVAAMVRALRRVSVERGVDPRGLTLCAFGGAGPMFVCRLAEGLGMTQAIVPPHPGVFSALGLAVAAPRLERTRSVHRPASALTPDDLAQLTAPHAEALRAELPGATVAVFADCRYPGQGSELTVACPSPAEAADAFHAMHQARYRHADRERDVAIVNIRVVATGETPVLAVEAMEAMEAVDAVVGPATVAMPDATLRVEAGWTASRDRSGAWLLEPSA
jgi:N-methylhydantoinase A/oxoprolinase/acetone carboxylase beta subunit